MKTKAQKKKTGRPNEGRKLRLGLVLTPVEDKHLRMLSRLTSDSLSVIIRAGLAELFRNTVSGQNLGELSRSFHEAFLKWTVVEAQRRIQGLPAAEDLPDGVESFVESCIEFLKEQQGEKRQPSSGVQIPVQAASA